MRELMRSISPDFFKEVFVTADKKFDGNFSEWENAVREATINDFSGIDVNKIHSPAVAEKIDAIGEKIFNKVKLAVDRFDPIPYFMDVERGQTGKTVEISRARGGRAYVRSYGGFARIAPIVNETITIDTRPYSVRFSEPLEKFKTGRLTVADLIVLATQAILLHRASLVFAALQDAYLAGNPAYRTDAGGVSLTKSMLDNAINEISDETDDYAIVGRRKLLNAISDFSGYSDDALEEIRKQGILGLYRGGVIVAYKRYRNKYYNEDAVPGDKIWVVSQDMKPGKFVQATPLRRRNWIDVETGRFNFQIDMEDGAAVWDLEYGRMIYNLA